MNNDIENVDPVVDLLIREVVNYVAEEVEAMLVDDDNGPADDSSDDSDISMDDSDSSDDENAPRERRQLHRVLNYIENTVHLSDNQEFRSHFRIERGYTYELINRFSQTNFLINNDPHENAISHEKAFLLTLWYLANTETFREVSDRFNVTSSSSHRVLQQTLNFINSLRDEFIHWPDNDEEKQVISERFNDIQGLDNVIGAIDGCHIRIVRPEENQRDYYNRKRYHSIVLQVVATSDKNIIDFYVGEPGSMHDARVCRRSPIYERAQADPNFFGRFHLLGDSAYANLPWLVTPFRDDGRLTHEEREFNYRHSATRVVIEHTFGDLKTVFRRLQKFHNIRMDIILNCISSACILHNIRNLSRQNDSDDESESDSDLNDDNNNDNNDNNDN